MRIREARESATATRTRKESLIVYFLDAMDDLFVVVFYFTVDVGSKLKCFCEKRARFCPKLNKNLRRKFSSFSFLKIILSYILLRHALTKQSFGAVRGLYRL